MSIATKISKLSTTDSIRQSRRPWLSDRAFAATPTPPCNGPDGGNRNDSQAQVRRVSPVFAKAEPENRQAPQSRDLQIAPSSRGARARGAVLQASLIAAAARRAEKKPAGRSKAGKGDSV